MWKAKLKIPLLIALVFTLTGCSLFGSIEWEWTAPGARVNGTVALRNIGAPLAHARVLFKGPVQRSVTTKRTGAYSVDLPSGTYDVTVRTLHGEYSKRLYVGGGTERIDLEFSPGSWFDRSLFLSLSGIRRWYFDGDRLVYRDDGELARWEQSRVRVYFDGSRVPAWSANQWAKSYMNYVQSYWGPLLRHTIAFERVESSTAADVVVRWVEPGTLTDPEGYRVAAQSFYYWQDGSLSKVVIEIDADWADVKGLWEHEWARAMGVGYSDDSMSLMYPDFTPSQRTSLTSREQRHVQLMYDLPSGLSRAQVWSLAAEAGGSAVVEGDEADALPLVALDAGLGTGYGGHVRRVDGQVVPVDSLQAADKVFGS